MLKNIVLVALGGAFGSALRYVLGIASRRFWNIQFPTGTFLVNILGSLLIGLLVGYFAKTQQNNEALKLLLVSGFCGGFTTFSSFSQENISLIQNNQIGLALLYISASIVLGLLAVWLGISLMKA